MDETRTRYTFYPRTDDPCANVGHCPHVGGAAIASLVLVGNQNELHQRYLYAKIDSQREENLLLSQENKKRQTELDQVKLERKVERQNKFATNKQKHADPEPIPEPSPEKPKKKRGAPVGHPGWFRATPSYYDL